MPADKRPRRCPALLANVRNPERFYRVEQMRFAGKRPNLDKSTVLYNANITVTGIPFEAYDYVVSGKSALEWVMERQCLSARATCQRGAG